MVRRMNVAILGEMNNLNMDILDVCHTRLDSSWNYHLCSSFTRIYMVIAGQGHLRWEDGEVDMTPGNIYIVPAGLEFFCSCPDHLEKIHFHINILDSKKHDLFNGFPRVITLTDCREITDAVLQRFEISDTTTAFSLNHLLWQIVSKAVMQENISFGNIHPYSERVKTVMKLVEKTIGSALDTCIPLTNQLKLKTLASQVHCSPDVLQKEFSAQVGVSLRKYINDRIFIAAEHELRITDRPFSEISDCLGFCDQFYFSRCFSSRYGLSPREYRKNNY